MARLEIEVGVSGHSGVKKNLNDIENGIDKLNAKHSQLTKNIAEVTAVSRGLEAELGKLGSQFRSGAISESVFNKESREVGEALASARQASVQYQSELTSLNATIKQNASGQNQYGQSVKKLEGYHKSFNSGIRSTNSIAIEFGRIVQDLPYGVQGVANNIQQLTTNFGYYATSVREAAKANGQVVTTSQILKGAFSSFLTPANLLTLSISAITAGWVAYERWSQKAAKATKDIASSTKSYVDTLDAVRASQLQAAQSAQGEISKLDALYQITQDTTRSTDDRKKAVDELQKTYPAYFKNISDEAILNGNARVSYDKLRSSILSTAQAKAAYDKISQNASKSLENEFKLVDLSPRLGQLDQQIAKAEEIFNINQKSVQGQNRNDALASKINKLYSERRDIVAQIDTILGEQNQLLIDNVNLADRAKKLYSDQVLQVENITKATNAQVASLVDYGSKLDDILNKSSNQADASLLSGLDLDIEKTRQKYESLYQQINLLETKASNDVKLNQDQKNAIIQKASDARVKITDNEIKEQSANIIKNTIETEQKVNDIAFDYTRRLNESNSQRLIRQLNAETKIKYESLSGDLDAQIRLQEDYYRKVEQIANESNQRNIIANNDGSPLYKEIAQAELALTNLKKQFEDGLISTEAFEASREGIQGFIEGLDIARDASMQLADMAGTVFNSILFDGENTSKAIGRAFKSLASSIISDILRIAATKAIANIFTGGGAGILGSILGFASGGYTGNVGRNQIAGVVHGQEMVINADATKKNRALLEAINSNRALPSNSVSTPTSNLTKSSETFIAESRIQGSDILTVYRRASKEEERYVG